MRLNNQLMRKCEKYGNNLGIEINLFNSAINRDTVSTYYTAPYKSHLHSEHMLHTEDSLCLITPYTDY